MSNVLHVQQTIRAPAPAVFDALTDSAALAAWFAEHTSVSVEEKRYDFWGRYTPETPSELDGRHEIQEVEPNRRLSYTWRLRGSETTVDLRLAERDDVTILGLWHHDVPDIANGEPDCYSVGDLWLLWLENLRRYVEGRPVIRSDFSTNREGNLALAVDIDGQGRDVWEALTNPKQLNRWIASDSTVEPQVGGVWIDWGEDVGALNILEIAPGRSLTLGWQIEGAPTVVTWTIDESGGRTRLTLSHSGFATDRRSDAEWSGWLNYLSLIKSLVEVGTEWVPPLQELTRDVALYYATVIWTRQDELLDESDDEWS